MSDMSFKVKDSKISRSTSDTIFKYRCYDCGQTYYGKDVEEWRVEQQHAGGPHFDEFAFPICPYCGGESEHIESIKEAKK